MHVMHAFVLEVSSMKLNYYLLATCSCARLSTSRMFSACRF